MNASEPVAEPSRDTAVVRRRPQYPVLDEAAALRDMLTRLLYEHARGRVAEHWWDQAREMVRPR